MVNFVSSSGEEGSGAPRKRPSDEIVETDDFTSALSELEKRLARYATTDQLAEKDQPLEQSAVDFEKHVEQKLKNENDRDKQANVLRALLFWVATSLVILTILFSGFLAFWVVVVKDQFSAPVIISFISGLTIEALGLLYVIAQYLFPSSKKA